MKGHHVYVDESKRKEFVLVAAGVLPGDLDKARHQVRSLYLPGQRGIHMTNEKEGRQRTILRTFCELDVEVDLYVARRGSYKTDVLARRRCLEALVEDAAKAGYAEICLDRDETIEDQDRRVIRRSLQTAGYLDHLRYHHSKCNAEPLLAIPDAVAWAWPQRSWRGECNGLVRNVIYV